MDRTDIIRTRLTARRLSLRELSDQTGIALRTLQRHIAEPDNMTLGELRAIHNRLRFTDDELALLGRTK